MMVITYLMSLGCCAGKLAAPDLATMDARKVRELTEQPAASATPQIGLQNETDGAPAGGHGIPLLMPAVGSVQYMRSAPTGCQRSCQHSLFVMRASCRTQEQMNCALPAVAL